MLIYAIYILNTACYHYQMDQKNILEKTKKTFSKVTGLEIITIILVIFLIAIIIIFWLGYKNLNKINSDIASLSIQISSLDKQFASSTNDLNNKISDTHNSLSTALDQEKQNVGNLQQTVGNYQQQVGSVSNTVYTLQKLSKTDPQLLEKYSKVFFLNENYAPARLTEIPSDYKYSDLKALKLSSQVWPYLQRMLDDANRASTTMYVYSAYRSFSEQKALKGEYTVVYGAGTANSFSADQGYSEHQLGTTVDLITTGLGGQLDGFDTTKSYTWLINNAYRYGFILSYPKNNKYYVYEPWHWRFVGVKLATDLHNQNKTNMAKD